MRLGLILTLLWCLVVVISFTTLGFRILISKPHPIRWMTALTAVGSLMTYGFVSAFTGIAEKYWTYSSHGFLIALCIGIAGVVLLIVGVRAIFQPTFKPGHCLHCGYPRSTKTICPECGFDHAKPWA
jgi:hypothetical protein